MKIFNWKSFLSRINGWDLYFIVITLLYIMEGQSISRAFRFPLSHLPTFFLTIGYPVYWLELYVFRLGQGRTTPLAWIIVSIFTCFVFFQNIPLIKMVSVAFWYGFLKSDYSLSFCWFS